VDLDESKNLVLDFPINSIETSATNKTLNEALGKTPQQTFKSTYDYLLTFSSQEEIEALEPDFSALSKIDTRGIIVTAPGDKVDFVSRFFAPASGIDEDPVTGSAHCSLIPFWSEKLNKTKLAIFLYCFMIFFVTSPLSLTICKM
jgi:predicted PhzF superfamily epimerase YddE/YHI9